MGISELLGVTLHHVHAKVGDNCIQLNTGLGIRLSFEQLASWPWDVSLQSVNGSILDLILNPLTHAEIIAIGNNNIVHMATSVGSVFLEFDGRVECRMWRSQYDYAVLLSSLPQELDSSGIKTSVLQTSEKAPSRRLILRKRK